MAGKSKTKGIRYWKKRAWNDAFSPYIRLRDAIKTTGTKTHLLCCTCSKIYPAFGRGCAQAGHFVPGRTHALLFREKGVHGQCYNCNHTLKGNWVNYEKFMLLEYGLDTVCEEKAAKYSNLKYNAVEMQEIYEKYKRKLEALKGE
jgi:hypothetical protein